MRDDRSKMARSFFIAFLYENSGIIKENIIKIRQKERKSGLTDRGDLVKYRKRKKTSTDWEVMHEQRNIS